MAKRSARIAAQKKKLNSFPKLAAPKKRATKVNAKVTSAAKVKTAHIKPSTARRATIAGATKKIKGKQSEVTETSMKSLGSTKAKMSKDTSEKHSTRQPAPVMVYNDELKTTGWEYHVESIVDSRKDDDNNVEYLVKWVGYPASANSWEPEVHLRNATDFISEYDDQYPEKP